MERLSQVPVLLLDELVIRPDTSQHEADALTEVLYDRLANEAITVVSTNVGLDDDAGATLGPRIASRLMDASSGNVLLDTPAYVILQAGRRNGLTTAIEVVDIETSGLSYERHQILQVGVWLANLSSGRVTLYELNALTPSGRTVLQRPTK